MTSPWEIDRVALEQRALVDQQLARWRLGEPMPQFTALRDAVAYTQCPGMVLEVGAASGYSMEIIPDEYRQQFTGVDISAKAIEIAKARYPQAVWGHIDMTTAPDVGPSHDIVIDGSCLLHIDDWKEHLRRLCALSRRWVILHRVPVGPDTHQSPTQGYGQTFPAWKFSTDDIEDAMASRGFEMVQTFAADGGNSTAVFAKPRHVVSYADDAYLSRLRALHGSLVRHARPFRMHVLSWGERVTRWCSDVGVDVVEARDFLRDHVELLPENLPGPPRSKVEHYWTVGPAHIASVIHATGEPCCYLDADLYAFGSLEPMFAEIGGAPAGFVGHNFAPVSAGLPGPTVESHERFFGALNVGAVAFSDPAVAARWAELCRTWCYDRYERLPDGRSRFGDQKYLEWLCEEFPGCHMVKEPAAMVGPWNLHSRPLSKRGGTVYFGDKPMGLYHFSALKILPHGGLQRSRPEYGITDEQARILYDGYVREITS